MLGSRGLALAIMLISALPLWLYVVDLKLRDVLVFSKIELTRDLASKSQMYGI